ncbi:hypothetical protein BU17DRAFT_81652 [Hysterangium stoloniferum]|nr:hypothetical protein BU17DRAFT_81652 [Hysterangium stoloniferum]
MSTLDLGSLSSSLPHHRSQHLASLPKGRPVCKTRVVKDITTKYPDVDQALIESFVADFDNMHLAASSQSCIDACITKLKTLNLITERDSDTDDSYDRRTRSRNGRNTQARQKLAPYQKRASRSKSPPAGTDAECTDHKIVSSRWRRDAAASAKSPDAKGPFLAYGRSPITRPVNDRVLSCNGQPLALLESLSRNTMTATEGEYDTPYPDINCHLPPAVWSSEDYYASSDTSSSSGDSNSDSDSLLGDDDLGIDDNGMNRQAPAVSYSGDFYLPAYEMEPADSSSDSGDTALVNDERNYEQQAAEEKLIPASAPLTVDKRPETLIRSDDGQKSIPVGDPVEATGLFLNKMETPQLDSLQPVDNSSVVSIPKLKIPRIRWPILNGHSFRLIILSLPYLISRRLPSEQKIQDEKDRHGKDKVTFPASSEEIDQEWKPKLRLCITDHFLSRAGCYALHWKKA